MFLEPKIFKKYFLYSRLKGSISSKTLRKNKNRSCQTKCIADMNNWNALNINGLKKNKAKSQINIIKTVSKQFASECIRNTFALN